MRDLIHCPESEIHQFLGARPMAGDSTEFAVWAPWANEIRVEVAGEPDSVALQRQASGLHTGLLAGVTAGARYTYRVDGGPPRPDPASRFQPDGVHGPSEVIDRDFEWSDGDWSGPDLEQMIIYELHLGAFTPEGTYAAAIERLPELVELGVTAVELMPVAAAAGRWNWGYDGVALFAPAASYGTPDDFRRFVDAAHNLGLAVFLDVVYNHLGPEGNYLNEFGPYLSDRHQTVWGDAPNFDDPQHGDAVRRFFIANAVAWLDEYHLDGLRVDAIHCMVDDRQPHVAAEISDAVAGWAAEQPRRVLLIAESNIYDPEMLVPTGRGGIGFDAMWCDDFLHSTFAVLRPGESLCDREYHPRTDLDQTLRYGYVYEGTMRAPRQRRNPERPVARGGLVYSIQNHDFIGNHPLGQRLHQLTSPAAHRAAAALMMLSPAIPMLFMGEEFACENPFRFFVDFTDNHLRLAVVEGRRREYPQHDWDAGILPTDPEAFFAAKIGPREAGNLETLEWYRRLIQTRHTHRQSGLLSDARLHVESDLDQGLYVLQYQHARERLTAAVRLLPESSPADPIPWHRLPQFGLSPFADDEVLLDSRAGQPQAAEQLLANHAVVRFTRQANA